MIRNPREVGADRISEKPESWDSTAGPTQAVTTQGLATIRLPTGPLSMDGAQGHVLKHTLTNSEPSTFEASIQNELTLQLRLDKDKKHRSFAWKLLPSHPSSKTLAEARKEFGEKKSRLHNQRS